MSGIVTSTRVIKVTIEWTASLSLSGRVQFSLLYITLGCCVVALARVNLFLSVRLQGFQSKELCCFAGIGP